MWEISSFDGPFVDSIEIDRKMNDSSKKYTHRHATIVHALWCVEDDIHQYHHNNCLFNGHCHSQCMWTEKKAIFNAWILVFCLFSSFSCSLHWFHLNFKVSIPFCIWATETLWLRTQIKSKSARMEQKTWKKQQIFNIRNNLL